MRELILSVERPEWDPHARPVYDGYKANPLEIIFQAARFGNAGTKAAHAKLAKVVHNGRVIQEEVEVPYA